VMGLETVLEKLTGAKGEVRRRYRFCRICITNCMRCKRREERDAKISSGDGGYEEVEGVT